MGLVQDSSSDSTADSLLIRYVGSGSLGRAVIHIVKKLKLPYFDLDENGMEWSHSQSVGSILLSALLQSYFVAATIEEGVKAAIAYNSEESRGSLTRKQYFMGGLCVGLGFAAIENLLYEISYPGTFILRTFLGPPGHMAYVGITTSSFIREDNSFFPSYATAVAFHGTWNFMLMFFPTLVEDHYISDTWIIFVLLSMVVLLYSFIRVSYWHYEELEYEVYHSSVARTEYESGENTFFPTNLN